MTSPSATTVLDTVLDPALDEERPGPRRTVPPARGGGPFDPGGPSGPGGAARAEEPPIRSADLAMMAFIVFESMLFVPLMGSFFVLRWGSRAWPPPGQPYFPIGVTWVNTLVLLGSLIPLRLARNARASGARTASFVRFLAIAAAMGTLFLAVQGFEWTRLLAHGLTVRKSVYGAIFLVLIGTHALHVLGATIALIVLAVCAALGRGGVERGSAFRLSAMYWTFVCALWIALFVLVYLL